MLDKVKAVIEQLQRILQNIINVNKNLKSESISIKPIILDLESIHASKSSSIYRDFKMVQSDLLNSLEKIISDDFCVLKESDTLADALSLVLLQNITDIIVIDSEGKFAGIVRDLSVLTEVPPPLKDIPFKDRIQTPNLQKQISEFIVKKIKLSINKVFNLNQNFCNFNKTVMIVYALEELGKPYRTSNYPKIIPILNDDQTVAGIVSCKRLLEYIKNDRYLIEAKISEFLLEKQLMKKPYTLLPDHTLNSALFAINYLPIDYILICDAEKTLVGMVNRHQISAFSHPMYYHLINIPLENIKKPVDSLYLVKPSDNLMDVITSFLESDTEVAVVMDTSSDRIPIGIITPSTILQFVLHKIRSNIK